MLWLGQAAVVSLPAEVDILLADRVREDLLSVLNRGPAALIVDMSRTTFCDSSGVHALVRAHKRAAASGADMRLVVTAPGVQRVLAITGVDRLITVSPTVSAALAAAGRPAEGRNAPSGRATAPADPDDLEPQPS